MSIALREGHEGRGHEHGQDEDCGRCESRVKVPFNNKEVFVYLGNQSVATLKRLAGIPLTDDLDQLVGSKIVPLPDDGKVHITGCEIFIHHPKDGASS